jgi:hypothetical protein
LWQNARIGQEEQFASRITSRKHIINENKVNQKLLTAMGRGPRC